ncbi:WhiB family transcriptional regulator [Kocuria flava]|uniref:WhiB family transcriptional regulator n=1 Tax=Kocuria flava TaxID=446860 RepID=UPI003F1D3143
MTATVQHRPNAHAPAALTKDHAAAHNKLTARLAEVLDAGESIPCLDSPHAADWIADGRDAQDAHDRAVAGCRPCPALTDCALYALAYPEPAGVWGAMTPTDRQTAHRPGDTP